MALHTDFSIIPLKLNIRTEKNKFLQSHNKLGHMIVGCTLLNELFEKHLAAVRTIPKRYDILLLFISDNVKFIETLCAPKLNASIIYKRS